MPSPPPSPPSPASSSGSTPSTPVPAPADDPAHDSPPGGLPLLDLPPGFRFVPTDPDMVCLLRSKVSGQPPPGYAVPGFQPPRDLDVSLFEPQELPCNNGAHYKHKSYFFTTRTIARPGGAQPSRPTPKGCWKGSGRDDRQVRDWDHGGVVGFKKMFVYYRGKAPNEVRTVWMMKEVRLNPRWGENRNLDPQKMQSWVMCKVYNYLEEEEGTEDHEAYKEGLNP